MKKRIVILSALVLLTVSQLVAFPFRGKHSSNYTVPEGMDLSAVEAADGVYEGTAVGYREGLTVDVTVEDSQVVDIEIVDHNEIGRRYYQKAMDLIPAAILKAESTDVDSVSGATCTSYGIMSAVEDALHNF